MVICSAMIEESVVFKTSRGLKLAGRLFAPDELEHDVVIFAHGITSSKESPRNRAIADRLLDMGVASFLFDFTGHGQSDGLIEQSTPDQQLDDLTSALDFIDSQVFFQSRFVGVHGSSTGGTAAVRAAAEDPRVQVLVLRVPRNYDVLALAAQIEAPTLVVQGSEDSVVLPEATAIYEALTCPKDFHVIQGAGHLFDEKPEYLEDMTEETCAWFSKWFGELAAEGD